jgi:anthranilate/para-aminobenzoate synthase component II
MKGVIINHDSDYIEDLKKLFPECDVLNYKDFDKNLMKNYHYIILSGGDINVSGENDIVEEKDFIKNTYKPVLGICLGHQIIGLLNGAELYNNKLKEFKEKRSGFKTTNLLGRNMNLYYYHYCYIDNISSDFDVTYDSYQGVDFITFMENRERKTVGIQYHPEKSGIDGKFIKNYFMKNYVKKPII